MCIKRKCIAGRRIARVRALKQVYIHGIFRNKKEAETAAIEKVKGK